MEKCDAVFHVDIVTLILIQNNIRESIRRFELNDIPYVLRLVAVGIGNIFRK